MRVTAKQLFLVVLLLVSAISMMAAIPGPLNVLVTNTVSAPVPVRDVDKREPFATQVHLSVAAGDLSGGASVPVPAGKLLVIECVTASANVYPGQDVRYFVVTQFGETATTHYVPGRGQAMEFPGGLTEITNAQQVRFFADPQTNVGIAVRRNSAQNAASADVTISGYLVSVP